MPLDARNLSFAGHGGAGRLWLYATADARSSVVAPGYFNDAAAKLIVGDLILASCGSGGSPAPALVEVSAVAPAVTVAQTAGTGTVTSVGLALLAALADLLSIAGTPVTAAGTLTLDLQTQAANRVLAGPATGVDAQPAMRALVGADIPALVPLVVDVSLVDGDDGHVVSPIAGTLVAIRSVLRGGAVTTNDAVLTWKIGGAGAGTAITDGGLTIVAAGSAEGDTDSAAPSAQNAVAAGDLIYCTVSNTPGGTRTARATLLINPTATA